MSIVLRDRWKKKLINFYLKFFNFNASIYLARKSVIASNCSIGYGTRINGRVVLKGAGDVTIGRYCAVGYGVKIITSNHDHRYINLQFYLQKKIGATVPHINCKGIEIGHNAWIGDSVIILPDVKIGNGAVIGAGSIVTKDIPPYAIAVGNPARIIKFRFSQKMQEDIEKLQWWKWSLEEMRKNIDLFSVINDERSQ